MAKRTRKRSRSRKRRQRGGGDGEPAPEVEDAGSSDANSEPAVGSLLGGKRRRKGKKSKRKTHKKRITRKKGKKRGLNGFFKLMLDAKKKGLSSFKYKGKTYKGRKHHRLGMIYKKK